MNCYTETGREEARPCPREGSAQDCVRGGLGPGTGLRVGPRPVVRGEWRQLGWRWDQGKGIVREGCFRRRWKCICIFNVVGSSPRPLRTVQEGPHEFTLSSAINLARAYPRHIACRF